jgi:hypothetical protein
MNKLSGVFLASAFFAAGAFSAGFVVQELDDAHGATDEALRHLDEANKHHRDQFGGHEGKATELLNQARHEIEEADRFFKEHRH